MSESGDEERAGARRLARSLVRQRWLLGTASASLVLVAVTGGNLAVLLAGFIAIVGAAYVRPERPLPRVSKPAPRPAEALYLTPEALVEALPDPAVILRRSGQVDGFNAAARRVFPAIEKRTPISFLIRTPEVLEAVERVRRAGGREEARLTGRSPLDKAYDVALALVPQRRGEPIVLLQLRDITEAQRIERMRTDFVANASHELRTPLASVLGFIETLQGPARKDEAAQERFLGIMAQQAKRMSRLIDDLLSLSKIEQRAHVRPREEVALWDVVEHVADGLQPLAHDLGVTLTLAKEAELTAVHGDRDELTRVMENLIENAIKYGRDGERVTVTATSVDNKLLVEVRDHGPGIAPEDLPRLTERFYRVDVAGSRAMGGTGLGLALVKNILLRHGGRLRIASVLGEGATFTVELPLPGI